MANALGIYFGPKVISLVVTKGKKILNSVQIKRSVLSSGEIEEKVPDEVKIVALFKEELRRNNIEAKGAALSLSGKDLIIRSFEVPVLPANELPNVIGFEAKKFIPFKTEEIFSDFQVQLDKASRRYQVLYVGIKKETLDKYLSIMHQLNIKVESLEYAAFSSLRFLKLTNFNIRGTTALITMDLTEGDEINFTILENGFPLFSRDISLGDIPQELLAQEEITPGAAIEKVKSEIRISLDYYQRKFSNKKINKLFFISEEGYRADLEAFLKDLDLSAHFINVARYLGRGQGFSLGFLKGYGASLSPVVQTGLKINLLALKTKLKSQREAGEQSELAFWLSTLKINPIFVITGIIICLVTFGFGFYRQIPARKQLYKLLSVRPAVADLDLNSPYEVMVSKDNEYANKIEAVDRLITKYPYLTEVLDVIPRLTPADIRLTKLYFRNKEDNKPELSLEGIAYLGDRDKELKLVNSFVAQLKQNAVLKKYFRDISVQNIDHRQIDKATVTNFTLSFRG